MFYLVIQEPNWEGSSMYRYRPTDKEGNPVLDRHGKPIDRIQQTANDPRVFWNGNILEAEFPMSWEDWQRRNVAYSVTEVQATGASLQWIRDHVEGTPFSTNLVDGTLSFAEHETWYGDHAKFIATVVWRGLAHREEPAAK